MKPSPVWILIVSIFFELAPVIAAVRARRTLSPALALVALCFLLMFVQDVAMWRLAQLRVNNLWLVHLGVPVQTGLLLAAFSHWQREEVERLTLRIALLGFLLIWAGLFLVEEPDSFTQFSGPLRSVLLVTVSAWTLIRRSQETTAPVARADWFWISTALLLYFATSALINPVSRVLMESAPHLVQQAFLTKATFNICLYLLVARGILCRMPLESSGGFWSPRPSSRSSSPPPSYSR